MRIRNQRGVAFPSPVAILSIVAIAMAGITYVATQGEEPTEREVTTVAQPSAEETATAQPQKTVKAKKKPIKAEPQVQRGEVYVEVYNNSGITGLAGTVAGTAAKVGWQVVGTDNWYGTVPSSTVYYPPRLADAAELLALDLDIGRTMPAVGDMNRDRLTVVLTADAA
ncbi:LytR C-terminal domain-containing protein [Nocardioides euryhalodurans]|uniref:LytR family transcriptional regulator n=1 Tax=Nocardioides euryhalodurans TaxID=2518370 RepID=A0A4P7GN37_9ACTN|nr:LytR C-terminal domain-containing protein [Nocardioides euryhalodurans]QBR93460.1 LytR family transcriptional regulator [Nocardioides euryhalodurans]